MNPYQPPAAEAAHDLGDNPAGRLWHVLDGQLRIRDGASLPEICLSGASPGEPGERKDIVLSWCPAWARHLPAIPFLGWVLCIFLYSYDDPKALGMLATAALLGVLCWPVSKRGRLHLFQSDQAKRELRRRGWIESLILFGALTGAGLLISRIFPNAFAKGGSGLISGLFTFVAVSLRNRRSVRICEFKSGWFALANVDQAAIARLAEIQSRPDQPPLSKEP